MGTKPYLAIFVLIRVIYFKIVWLTMQLLPISFYSIFHIQQTYIILFCINSTIYYSEYVFAFNTRSSFNNCWFEALLNVSCNSILVLVPLYWVKCFSKKLNKSVDVFIWIQPIIHNIKPDMFESFHSKVQTHNS